MFQERYLKCCLNTVWQLYCIFINHIMILMCIQYLGWYKTRRNDRCQSFYKSHRNFPIFRKLRKASQFRHRGYYSNKSAQSSFTNQRSHLHILSSRHLRSILLSHQSSWQEHEHSEHYSFQFCCFRQQSYMRAKAEVNEIVVNCVLPNWAHKLEW